MKREELPGFVRELPIAILTLAIIIAFVFWPIYRHYKKKAEELKNTKAQEIELIDEIIEDAPGSVDEPETNEDSDGSSD